VFEPAFGLMLRPEIAALTMSGSSAIVAINAVLLRRLRLPSPSPFLHRSCGDPSAPTGTVGSSAGWTGGGRTS
jgi:Cu2+-exporting ATPase